MTIELTDEQQIKIAAKNLEKGKKEGIIEMAMNSIKEGLPTELIAKLTGLTMEEIEKLKTK